MFQVEVRILKREEIPSALLMSLACMYKKKKKYIKTYNFYEISRLMVGVHTIEKVRII